MEDLREKDDEGFSRKFMGLVDAWVEANPVQSSALSAGSVRFAAAKILILKSGHLAKFRWPGENAARLAGTLLVLFVHEGLLHDETASCSNASECKVLGIGLSELYGILKDVIRLCAITREDLMSAVMEVDLEGTTMQLAHSNELASALFAGSSVSSGDLRDGSREDTGVRWLQPPRPIKANVKYLQVWRLGLQLIRARNVVICCIVLLYVMGDAYNLSWLFPTWSTMLMNLLMTLQVATTSVIFPERLDSKGACRYVLPLLASGWGTMSSRTALGLYKNFATLNSACRVVYALLCVGNSLNIGTHTVLCWRNRFSWGHVRAMLFVDGLTFCGAVSALHYFGPLERYPPGDLPFAAGLSRGLTTLLAGALFNARWRRRMRRFSARLGFSRFTQALGHFAEVRMGDGDGGESVAESARIDELSSSGLAAPVQQLVRQRLAQRYMRVRVLLCVLVGLWFVLADLLGLWHWNIFGPTFMRQLIFASILSLGASLIAGSFPSKINSPEGLRFILPATVVCAVCAVTSSFASMLSPMRAHVNGPCRLCHSMLCVSIVANWGTNALMCISGRTTWRVLRTVLCIDGLIFCTTALLMLYLGPSPVYQPRDCTFLEAQRRGSITILLSALLNSKNRHRLAAVANRVGLNHVKLDLSQMDERRVRFAHQQPDDADDEGLHDAQGKPKTKDE